MRFDDRLKTVLAQPARSDHDRAVRWRQLVELLVRASGPATELVERAWTEVRAERERIDEQLRAATARAVARPQLPVELVAFFAEDTISVAAPVLAAASLGAEEWVKVLAQASAEGKRFILALHPEGGAGEAPSVAAEPAIEQPDAARPIEAPSTGAAPHTQAAPQTPIPSISEVVARIERLRESRRPRTAAQPRGGRDTAASALFRWECGPSGEIAWVEGAPRGALIGRSLANPGENNGVDDRIKQAFALRAPFRDASLSVSGEGIAAGQWKLSGVPAFEPLDGRFAGYRGVATRPASVGEAALARPQLDEDSVRELVHELKTPLNAIIGFAEIIDGQYLGPADFAYRERAGQIVAQARLLLAAIEDLDTAAQLRSARAQAGGSSDLAEVVAGIAAELQDQAARRGARLDLEPSREPISCALERGLAERVVRRFCSGVLEALASGERIAVTLSSGPRFCSLSIDRPSALQDGGLERLLETTSAGDDDRAGLGSAFSLRLARALAFVAGGEIALTGKRLILRLPAA